jgi:selenocysteine lyase/cysteine desulfurase
MQRTFDVRAVREQFPALGRIHSGRKVAYFDGPGGSQVARPAIDAVSGYMEDGGANLHGAFPTSRSSTRPGGRGPTSSAPARSSGSTCSPTTTSR